MIHHPHLTGLETQAVNLSLSVCLPDYFWLKFFAEDSTLTISIWVTDTFQRLHFSTLNQGHFVHSMVMLTGTLYLGQINTLPHRSDFD